MVLCRDLKNLTADLEKLRQLTRIGYPFHRRAQHRPGNQELSRERIGLLLGQRAVAMAATQEMRIRFAPSGGFRSLAEWRGLRIL